MFPLSLLMAGIGGIGSIIHAFSSNSNLSQLQQADPKYTASPYAAQRYGLAQTLLNARMPGATALERNIYGNQSNQLANINRNATDSSQALSLGSMAQGQTNQAFQNLSVQEQQDYYNRLQNLTGAQQGMIQEGDKVYQDQVRRYQDLASITGAKLQNTQTGFNSLANFGLGAAGIAAWSRPGMNNFMGMTPQGGYQVNNQQGQNDQYNNNNNPYNTYQNGPYTF